MITPENLVRHELIGLDVVVVESSNPSQAGLSGKVIDETRNMLTIETPGGARSLSKQDCTFSFRLPSGRKVRVEGRLLLSRPEDRVRKKLSRW